MNIEAGDRVVVDPDYLTKSEDKEGRLRRAGVMTVQEVCAPKDQDIWEMYYYCVNQDGMLICLSRKYLKKIRPSEGLFALDGIEEGLPGGDGVELQVRARVQALGNSMSGWMTREFNNAGTVRITTGGT